MLLMMMMMVMFHYLDSSLQSSRAYELKLSSKSNANNFVTSSLTSLNADLNVILMFSALSGYSSLFIHPHQDFFSCFTLFSHRNLLFSIFGSNHIARFNFDELFLFNFRLGIKI